MGAQSADVDQNYRYPLLFGKLTQGGDNCGPLNPGHGLGGHIIAGGDHVPNRPEIFARPPLACPPLGTGDVEADRHQPGADLTGALLSEGSERQEVGFLNEILI